MSEFKYNEEAWEQIFIDYHVLEEINKKGFFKITSEESQSEMIKIAQNIKFK